MKLYAKVTLVNVAQPGDAFEIDDKAGAALIAAGEAETAEQASTRLQAEQEAKAAELQQLADEAKGAAEQAAKDAAAAKAASTPTKK